MREILKDGKSITPLEMSKISERSGEQRIDTIYDKKPSPIDELDWNHPFWRDPNKIVKPEPKRSTQRPPTDPIEDFIN